MEKKPACYVYAPGQYVAHIRQMSTTSIGVTIPKSIAKNLKLRPGMEVMIQVSTAMPDISEEDQKEASQ